MPGLPLADQLCPGHPLLEAVIDLTLEQSADVLKRGAVLIDENDPGDKPRLLFYIEDAFQDGHRLPNGAQRIVDKGLQFVELDESGHARSAGYAPYLDYRAASEEEAQVVINFAKEQTWLSGSIEDIAIHYAMTEIVPAHYQEVKQRRQEYADKVMKAVKTRLTEEIQYWDYRAAELRQQEAAGRGNPKLNSENAQRRADDLLARLHKRTEELEEEKHVSPCPPVIAGGALVIPVGLLNMLTGQPNTGDLFSQDRRAVELAAMNCVMQRELAMGNTPKDVSRDNVGYDIESTIPEEHRAGGSCLRFIEVKGRQAGSTTVTVTKNEIITALNRPDEYILAIVEVDGNQTRATYLKHPFTTAPDIGATSVNYEIAELMHTGSIEY